jgi:hypothetical protein
MIPPEQLFAAVCTRRHVVTSSMEPNSQEVVPSYCRRCGARVLTRCDGCQAPVLGVVGRIAARYVTTDKDEARLARVVVADLGVGGWLRQRRFTPDPFCWRCGRPHPWATREQLIGKLHSLVDDQGDDLGEAERQAVNERLAVLVESDSEVSNEERVRAGLLIRRLAPKMWEAALPVLQSVLAAEIRRQLGLP